MVEFSRDNYKNYKKLGKRWRRDLIADWYNSGAINKGNLKTAVKELGITHQALSEMLRVLSREGKIQYKIMEWNRPKSIKRSKIERVFIYPSSSLS